MLESTFICPPVNYSRIVHTLGGTTFVAPQLNYNIDTILELKVELAKIKTEVKEIKKQLFVIHPPLINEIGHSEKSN